MELKGTVQSIVFRNASNGYTVLSLLPDDEKQTVTCVGILPLINVGDTVSLSGEETYHQRFGTQFKVGSYERVAPSSNSAIIQYLASYVLCSVVFTVAAGFGITGFGRTLLKLCVDCILFFISYQVQKRWVFRKK